MVFIFCVSIITTSTAAYEKYDTMHVISIFLSVVVLYEYLDTILVVYTDNTIR